MSKKKTPPSYGESDGPMIVAVQWKRSSLTGPAEHCAGGSFSKSLSSRLILFNAMLVFWLCVFFADLYSFQLFFVVFFFAFVIKRGRRKGRDGGQTQNG